MAYFGVVIAIISQVGCIGHGFGVEVDAGWLFAGGFEEIAVYLVVASWVRFYFWIDEVTNLLASRCIYVDLYISHIQISPSPSF